MFSTRGSNAICLGTGKGPVSSEEMQTHDMVPTLVNPRGLVHRDPTTGQLFLDHSVSNGPFSLVLTNLSSLQ